MSRKTRWGRPTMPSAPAASEFGVLLRQYLMEAALSQAELARRVHRAPGAVTRWVLGQDRPDPQMIIAVGNVLERDPHPLLEAAGWLPPGYRLGEQVLPPEVARLIELLPPGWHRAMDAWDERRVREAHGMLRFMFDPPHRHHKAAAG